MRDTENISNALRDIHQKIIAAANEYGRNPDEIKLLAVSKSQPISKIQAAYAAGQRYFAENYVQEALGKIDQLKNSDIEWHYIGAIQGNKTRDIAEHFSWVHTIDSVKHAMQLNQYRSSELPPLQVCIEVNLHNEANKGGVNPNELIDLASKVREMPRLQLRGLMSIPKVTPYFQEQRASAAALSILCGLLNRRGFQLDTLSMGMSQDFLAAIAEGATILRLGTAIFGSRSEIPND